MPQHPDELATTRTATANRVEIAAFRVFFESADATQGLRVRWVTPAPAFAAIERLSTADPLYVVSHLFVDDSTYTSGPTAGDGSETIAGSTPLVRWLTVRAWAVTPDEDCLDPCAQPIAQVPSSDVVLGLDELPGRLAVVRGATCRLMLALARYRPSPDGIIVPATVSRLLAPRGR